MRSRSSGGAAAAAVEVGGERRARRPKVGEDSAAVRRGWPTASRSCPAPSAVPNSARRSRCAGSVRREQRAEARAARRRRRGAPQTTRARSTRHGARRRVRLRAGDTHALRGVEPRSASSCSVAPRSLRGCTASASPAATPFPTLNVEFDVANLAPAARSRRQSLVGEHARLRRARPGGRAAAAAAAAGVGADDAGSTSTE